ncbi:hypothetical protein [Orenia marismortui]|uniref:Uncharacterized protein n=1 Tax=Orenia marismortui TaxID=46469 RepID=A0A4R8GG00_9FIRM|nr:hypothetical protein [Orenia marismortui]TDX44580.1 hypothetical protein C7959_1504 [Orenia marismortui]
MGCHEEFNYYKTLLKYNNRYKYLEGELDEGKITPNRCIITGLIKAVELLKEPVDLTIHTATPFGVKRASKGLGPNIDLVNRLLNLIETKQCKVDFNIWIGKGKELKRFIEKRSNIHS